MLVASRKVYKVNRKRKREYVPYEVSKKETKEYQKKRSKQTNNESSHNIKENWDKNDWEEFENKIEKKEDKMKDIDNNNMNVDR